MGQALQKVLGKLEGVKAASGGHVAKCPAHEDNHQSLKVDERSDGSVLLHCHAGCAKTALLAAMGLAFSDLYEPKDEAPQPAKKKLVATYDYRDLDGTLLYQSLRYQPKEFRQRRPDGTGGWSWNMDGVKNKKVPYRLNNLAGHTLVYVVEGEKDADRMWSIGLPATSNIAGAGKWGESETAGLKKAGVQRVVIIPDNDDQGKKHAQIVGASVKAAGIAVSIIELPLVKPHGDVSDWLDEGHTAADLVALVNTTPYVVQTQGPAQKPIVVDPGVVDASAFDPEAYGLTDAGAGDAFCARYKDIVRYDHRRDKWLIWDQHYWRPDADEEVYRIARDLARFWQKQALKIVDYEKRRLVVNFAIKLETRRGLENCLWFAKSSLPIATAGDMWNHDGWLLGCPNGVVDLKTGQLRPGLHDDLITQQMGAKFNPAATAPRWLKFVDEVFEGNLELIEFVHKALGYSLTGDMREQVFFMAFGAGSNGKSLFLDVLQTVWGSYGHRAEMRTFASGSGGEVSNFHLADFGGKRLISAAEVKPNSRMNEHVVKDFTGGEALRVERKFGDPFTIHPCGKIWLGVNHRPKVSDDSYGFWRRVRLIPFTQIFAGSSEDKMLKEKLRSEAEGILAWLVQGCLAWQQHGLAAPPVVVNETDNYQVGEDPLADFFDQRTEIDPTTSVAFSVLYAAYRDWAQDQGFSDRDKMNAKSFGHALSKRPFEKVKSNSTIRYKGLRVASTSLPYGGD